MRKANKYDEIIITDISKNLERAICSLILETDEEELTSDNILDW
jgi:hypothetical protein